MFASALSFYRLVELTRIYVCIFFCAHVYVGCRRPPDATDQQASVVKRLMDGSLAHLARDRQALEMISFAFGDVGAEEM